MAFQAAESFGQENAHPLGQVVLAEERLGVDAVLDQVGEIENGVAARLVEDAGAGLAIRRQIPHRVFSMLAIHCERLTGYRR